MDPQHRTLLPYIIDRFDDQNPVISSNFNAWFSTFLQNSSIHFCMLEFISDTACNRHSNETLTLRKHVTKYKTCKNGWTNFLENSRIVELNLLELTRFLSQNQSIYFKFERCWGPLCYKEIFRAYSIRREVYGWTHSTACNIIHRMGWTHSTACNIIHRIGWTHSTACNIIHRIGWTHSTACNIIHLIRNKSQGNRLQ